MITSPFSSSCWIEGTVSLYMLNTPSAVMPLTTMFHSMPDSAMFVLLSCTVLSVQHLVWYTLSAATMRGGEMLILYCSPSLFMKLNLGHGL